MLGCFRECVRHDLRVCVQAQGHRKLLSSMPCANAVLTEDQSDRVAIVMRTRDRPLLLARAFESVLSQVHQNWHLYLVNDGGDPRSVEHIRVANEDRMAGRITVLHNEASGGLAKALNTGLRVVEGNFLVIHDDDDQWHPNFLGTTLRFLGDPDNRLYVAVLARFYHVFEHIDGNNIVEINRRIVKQWPVTLKFFPLLYQNIFPPICYLIRMEAAKAVGLANEQLRFLEDTDYLRRLLIKGNIATIKEVLAFYHIRPTIAGGDLGNSTVVMNDAYVAYDRNIGNGLIRNFIDSNGANLGLIYALSAIGAHVDEIRRDLDEHLISDDGIRKIARAILEEQRKEGLPYKLSALLAKFAQAIRSLAQARRR